MKSEKSAILEEKIIRSKTVINEALDKFGNENICVSWTGGKDSTVMLWLYRQVCRQRSVLLPRCMFIDEGDLFDEIVSFVNSVWELWDIPLNRVKNHDVTSKVMKLGDMVEVEKLNERNRKELMRLDFQENSFPFEPESYVCNHLMKTVAMNAFLEENGIQAVSTGIRWDEQNARSKETYFSPRNNSDPKHTRIHPLLHFTERDIWEVTLSNRIPFCSLYEKGYRSLGIKSNTYKYLDQPAWEQDLENIPERFGRGQDKEQVMEKLRDLGYM